MFLRRCKNGKNTLGICLMYPLSPASAIGLYISHRYYLLKEFVRMNKPLFHWFYLFDIVQLMKITPI